jgi:glycosyltransferase involved in cell wall biosynthesis
MATTPEKVHLGMPAHQMAQLYNAFDVLVNPSYGEGFGVPIVEAQACGVPVIVTDWTSMPELCGAGWLVDGDPWYDASQGAFYKCPSIADIYERMAEAYETARDPKLGETAREFALDYDVDHVTKTYWEPVLEELGRPREIPSLPLAAPNRAARRAAAKTKAAV